MPTRQTTYRQLHEQLTKARQLDDTRTRQARSGEIIHPSKVGQTIANMYEQLRNAAELADDNIALQRAIKRFYKRTLFITHYKFDRVGQELLIELILSGYIQEGSVGEHATQMITELVTRHAGLYRTLRSADITQKKAMNWTLAVLSVKTYNLLLPDMQDLVTTGYCFEYFYEELPSDTFIETEIEKDMYRDALYVATHQALQRSDIDAVRTYLLEAHTLDGTDLVEYIHWNNYTDELYTAPLTLRLRRAISRNGAPFRVLRSLVLSKPPLETFTNRDLFLQAYNAQIQGELARLNKRLNTGIIKSIIFLLITKVIIGLGVEVPFDLYMYDAIAAIPLTINLLFPPLYMASIRLGLTMPSAQSAQRTTNFIDDLLFSTTAPTPKLPRKPSKRKRARLGYAILFPVPFVITYFILNALHFNPLQMVIFIMFFSTASFLGYRLSLMVRELRMVASESSVYSILRDLFYLPYILLGQWLAGRYAQINVIGQVLDLIIELPLKTVLSLIRQWIHFLNERHDELY